jgi:hypothetical protein
MSEDYRRLVSKVDAACAAITERRAPDLTCHAGCAGCCHVELTIADVEARVVELYARGLDPARRARLAERAALPVEPGGRCVMLEDDDRCAVHPARPLVCRTQGLPLLYPAGVVPVSAIRLRTSAGDVTVCPLNFATQAPGVADLVDAGHVDTVLALVDRLDAEARGTPIGARTSLRDVARNATR